MCGSGKVCTVLAVLIEPVVTGLLLGGEQSGHQDGAGEAGGPFTGLSKSPFNPAHHAPGFWVKFDQLSSPDLCPVVSMSRIGVYKT